MEPFTLSTERLKLDPLRADDAELIFEYCQDPEFERYLTIPWPYQRADADYFITEFVPDGWASGRELTWAVRSASGDLLGVIALRLERFDLGFWLGSPHRGHGYMPEAVHAVVDWAFGSGATEVAWASVAGNVASMAVARKCGFTFTGVGPATTPTRDGSRPESWHGVLRAGDDRSVKPGWPAVAGVGVAGVADVAGVAAPAENEGDPSE